MMDPNKWFNKWIKNFFETVEKFKFKKYISFDMETTGLNMCWDAIHFFTYDLNGKKGIVKMRPDLGKYQIPREVRRALEDPDYVKIIQSSQFDIPFFRMHTGIHLRNIWDTQVIEQVIRAGRGDPWHDSDLHVTLERRKIAKLDKSVRDSFIKYWGPITNTQEKYGIGDIKYLKELADQQLKDLRRDNLMAVGILENRTCEVTAELRYNGIEFDDDFWLSLAEENEKEYQRRINELPKVVDNWNSEKQIKKFFFEKHGITIESLSDLPDVKNKDLDKFKYAREMYSSISTYGRGFLTRKKSGLPLKDPDGRVRPSYNQIVDTGRYSCNNPNLQNQPAFGKHRYAYKAKKGTKLVVGDFTGQELGGIAAGSKEPVWIEAMKKGHDVHSVMADKMFSDWQNIGEKGCRFPFKCDCKSHGELRRPAKDLNFGLAYGKGVEAFARDMKMEMREARKIVRAYKRSIPTATKWIESNGAFAVKHGWIRTLAPFFRIRYMDGPEWRRRNQGKNTPIQGCGADMMKLAMVAMYEYIYQFKLQETVKLVLTVHDELLSEVKNNFTKAWAKIKKVLMERAAMVITVDRLVTTDPEIMDRWKPKREKR